MLYKDLILADRHTQYTDSSHENNKFIYTYWDNERQH